MKKIHLAIALFSAWLGISGTALAAENSIKQVQVRRDGDQVLLKVQLSAPLKAVPSNWSVVEPPRVVFDFPETDNQTGQTLQQVASGDLKSLNLVQTEKLTRLVLNLYRNTKFSTELAGDALFIRLEPQAGAAQAAPSAYQPAQKAAGAKAPSVPVADLAGIRDIAFRRGEDGQALIAVDLTDGSVPIDVRRSGNGLVVELRDVELPERLQNRRDVNDFATPVTQMTSSARGDNLVRIDIAARGRWFHQAHLANNQLLLEIKPIPADDANKLVQTGQQGQKVSINFYDADAAMVLRTLAEISGKNVLIDPSLSGRRVTANLDNIPYDQALEIIMSQVNSGMRVRNDVILFGDRAVLQKRDQDMADEAARAADTAPLVTETFRLNYVKAADIVALVNNSLGQTSTSAPGAAGTAQSAAPPAQGGAGGGGGRGMLSARGSISIHDGSNQVFVRDNASVIEAVRGVIRTIDVPPKQVMIEARIVEASTGFSESLGVRMRYFGNSVISTGNVRGALGTGTTGNFTNVDLFAGQTATPSLTASTDGIRTNWTIAQAGTTALNLMLFNSTGTKLLNLELLAAEADQKNKTVSAPRVVTQDRKNAKIDNTQQVTLLVGVNAQTGLPIYQTYSAPLTLDVTPSITPDNRVGLELKISKSTITNAATGSLDTNTLNTNVTVENGGTVVIGGFSREADIQSEERLPFLGDLPYVGFLFKAKTESRTRSELLVFITPRVVTDSLTQR